MSYAPLSSPSKLTERLTAHRLRDLTALIVKSGYPQTTSTIVQPLLEILVGGEFDLRENFLIREPAVVLLLLELLPKLSDQLQLEIWRTLGDIFTQSLSNIHSCRGLHLIERCLELLRKTTNDKVAVHIVRVIEIVGGYSISLKELRDILSYLYTGQQETWAPHSVPLIGALSTMATQNQPDVFFTFAGTPGAAITLPPISKWPSGFTINLWLRLETPFDTQRDYYKPVVYWFRTSRPEHGFSSHFIGNKLILETFGKGQKRPQTHALDVSFHCYRWYMLSVVYVHNRVKSSSLTCYVDGQQVLSADVSLPNTSDVYDKCFFGTSPSATEDVLFQGQLSAVYLFREPLKPDIVAALYRLGPSYKSQFRFEAECDVPLTQQQKKLLFDGHLSSSMCFSYNAKAVDGQLCLEASPNENPSPFTHSPHATLLEGVEPVVTTPFHTVLHSLGGVQALFPLFSQLDLPQSSSDNVDHSLSVKVLQVIFALAKNSTSCLLQLVQMSAMDLLSYLLRKVSPAHLSIELISCLFSFARYLGDAPDGRELLSQLVELLTSDLWTVTSVKVQTYLYSQIATEMGSRVLGRSGLVLPDLVGVSTLMDTLREHYSGVTAVRPYIILLVKEFLLAGKVSRSEAMQSILDYLSTVSNEEDLADVVELLLALLFEQQQDTMVTLFQQANGLNVAVKLLACSSENVILHSLKIISKVLHHDTLKQASTLFESHGLFSVIREKLLSARQPVTMAMFNTLFELMVNCPSRRIIDGHYIALDLSHQIWFPDVLPVMVELVCSLHTAHTDWTEGDLQLRMQFFSYLTSLCAQEPANCKAILRVSGWQHWVLVLGDLDETNLTDQSSLAQMTTSFLLHMLSHCLRAEQDGWKPWVETTATIHAFTSSRLEMSEMTDSLATNSLTELGSTSQTSLQPGEDPPQGAENELPRELISPPVIRANDLCLSEIGDGAHTSIEEGGHSPTLNCQTSSPTTTRDSPSPRIARRLSNSRPSSANKLGHPSPFSLSRITISRSSSTDTPNSPLMIPKSPTLNGGKMPPFEWTPMITGLLEDLLKTMCSAVTKGAGSGERSRASLTDYVGDDSNKYLRSNIAQLLTLIADSILELNGGVELLHSLAIPGSKKEAPATSKDAVHFESLLGHSLELCEVFVLSGLLRLTPVEVRMKMEAGGTLKQGLRMVMAAASIASCKTNTKYKEFHQHFHREKIATDSLHKDCMTMLKNLGLTGSSLEKYFESCKAHKLMVIRSCQCLLSDKYISLLSRCIPGDGESKVLTQQMVVVLFHYLSTLCVAKYQNILEAIKSEEKEEKQTPRPLMKQASRQSIAPNTKPLQRTGSVQVDADKENSPEPPPTPALSLHARALDISEQVEAAMMAIGPFLCQLLVEYRAMLSKVLMGADGRPLLTDAVARLAEGTRVVELTMLLCSQDWQSCLEKVGGQLFSELLADGRRVSQFSESYICSIACKVTSELEFSLSTQSQRVAEFEDQLALFLSESVQRCNKEGKMRKAQLLRHTLAAKELWRKISSVVDETGSFDTTPLRNSRFWRLDLRESHHRQRLQLLANPSGSSHKTAVRTYDTPSTQARPSQPRLPTPLTPSTTGRVLGSEEGSEELLDSLSTLEQSVGEGESSHHLLALPCVLIVLAHAVPGTLVFTRRAMSFTADDGSEEYKKAASYLMEYLNLNGEWLLSDVRAVISRRYLHQSKALEIFLTDRTSVFFVFESNKDVKTVVRKLPKVGIGCQYGLPQTRPVSLATPRQLFRKSTMTTRWVKREISNYEYLMYLNTVAGRSYNDLNQYPVFPWILTDYISKKLDLSNPNVYRDLTKPIGALNEARLKQFEERFANCDDDTLPPFHYGTHYSTMAFVLHWLVRVEPYSSLHIAFHDGLFDHGARMFVSVAEAWTNSNRDSSNVNELIPEFFYLPEMFLNENKFNFGREGSCGEGPVISDVQLPPWAESAHQFIRINREALESEYVSANLHHWIDLVFGFKQRGDAAIEAKNVFYYLTYAGAVDLDSIEDPKLRKGLEEQIRQFGQTPAQLLVEPHPSRLPLTKELPPQPVQGLNPRDPALIAELVVTPDVPIALVQLSPNNTVLVISSNQLYAVNRWTIMQGNSEQPTTVALEADPNIAAGLRMRLGDPLDQSLSVSAACFATPRDCQVIFVCGFWDNSFKNFSTESGKMIQSVFGHMGIVTCIDFSPENGLHKNPGDGLIATGSHDATVLLWRWCGRLNRVVGPHSDNQGPLAPLTVLTGHEQSVACVSLCSTLGLVVSVAAKYGYCLVHSTSGELLHKVTPSAQWMHPHLVCMSSGGHFVVHYADQKGCLALFTSNSKQLCQHTLDEPTLALAMTKDGRFVIIGGFDCRVKVFTAHDMKLKYAHERFDSSIRSLYISEDQKFIFAGLASGSIAVLTTHFWIQ